jgi:hypothetical protein
MATDETLAYFTNKKLMPLTMMETYVFNYLKSIAEAAVEVQYRLPGVYDAVTPITSPTVDDVSAAAAFEATDGEGKRFTFGAADSRLANVMHENTIAVVYNMGIRSVEIVDELDINPRTGAPEYRSRKETIGTLGTPDAVVDNGSDLTITVDAVTESGVTHAGRTVRVYLVTPKATSWASAYEDVVVAWSGGANKITTTGLLGQTAGSVSTTAADYVVVELGPVIVRTATADLTATSGVCFLADWTGTGLGNVVVPSTTNQRVLTGSLSDLADITRTDAHGDLKVSVRADASDSGEDQLRAESSAGARVWGVDEAGKHYLPNAASSHGLDDANYFAALGLPWNEDSFAGAINQNAYTLAATMSAALLSGLAYSSDGANVLNLTTGVAWMPGTTLITGGVRRYVTPAVSCADGSRYLYLTPGSSTVLTTATKSTAYANGNLPLYFVTFVAGSMTGITDLAYRAGNLNRSGIITVGNDERTANFTTLEAAFEYVASIQNQDATYWSDVEIWILDDIDVGTDSPTIYGANGVTIRGMNWRGESTRTRITYGDTNTDDCCMWIDASCDNIRFVGIRFESEQTGAGTATAGVRLTGTGLVGTTFDGCQFVSTNTNLAFAVSAGASVWTNARFNDCIFMLDGTGPTNVAVFEGNASCTGWTFTGCEVYGVVSKTLLAYGASAGFESTWERCVFDAIKETGIKQTSGVVRTRAAFVACSGSLGDIQNGSFADCVFDATQLVPSSAYDAIHYHGGQLRNAIDAIQSAFSGSIITVESVKPIGIAAGSTYVLGGVNPDGCHLRDCHVIPESANPISGGVVFTLGDNSSMVNCQVDALRTGTNQGVEFIQADGEMTRIIGNNLDARYYCEVIQTTGSSTSAVITGNIITNPTDHTTLATAVGIDLNGSLATVHGNTLYNIGNTTDGGIGILIAGTFNAVIGNTMTNVKGSGVHIAAAGDYSTVNGNVLASTGLAAVTNPKIAAVSNDGIKCLGDYCAIAGNVISTVVNDGINVGGDSNSITGNTTRAEGNRGIDLIAGSAGNMAQLNVTVGTVVDNGTNTITGGGNI